MGTLADSLFNLLMGWVRALVNAIWALFTTDHTTLLEFLGKNWVLIVVVILAAGLAIDWLVWLIRWQPYHLWARRARRFLRMPEPEQEEKRKKRAPSGDETLFDRPIKPSDATEIWSLVEQLDALYSVPLTMFYADGMKLEEIAAALHVPKGTVSARMTRGRQKLKTWMEEEL